MSAHVLEAQRHLPFPPEALFDLVEDVRRYPEFIEWIQELDITDERSLPTGQELVAHVVVGWRTFREKFATRVTSDRAAGTVEVALVYGPLRTLENRWRFTAEPGGGTLVRCHIRYEFKNPLLTMALAANRDRATSRIMGAFEAEAQRRYAASPSA